MKYSLVLTKDERDLLKDELNRIIENSCFLAKIVTAKSILQKIKGIETVELCNKENFVSESDCFSEGISGKCGNECKYFKLDGCRYEGE